jgi:succinoglycan biosynthesis transport protein ExoP
MEELELTEIINIIKKRKSVLILFILVSIILTTIYLLKTPPVYQATSTLLIESKPSKTISLEDILLQDSKDEQFFKTQFSLFQSRTLVKKLLIKLDLMGSEEFTPPPPLINFAPLKNWLKSTMVNLGIIQEKKNENTQTDPYSPLIDNFLDRLEVIPFPESKIVNLEFQGFSPLLTAKITNTLVDLYIGDQVEYNKILEADTEKWLKLQGAELSKGLKNSNSKIQKFKKNTNMVELDGKRDFTNQQYRDTLSEATLVRTKIIKLKSLIQQIDSFKSSPKQLFNSIPESLKDETIVELRASYLEEIINFEYLAKNLQPSHPDRILSQQKIKAIEERIPVEVNRLLRSLKADLKATQNQELELRSLQNKLKNNLMELDRKTTQFQQIELESESNRKLLDQLLTRGKEFGVYSSYYVPLVRIVDRAEVPILPIKPRAGLSLLLALSFGIFGGLILVFFVESIDNTIKNEEDANRQLPYRLLGSVGLYRENGVFNSSKRKAIQFEKEFQNLRTKFLPLLSENPTKVFLITSTFPGEGKTTVTSNLAVSLGKMGKKVVIIDADMENPKIHKKFETQKSPGLINILSGSKVAKQVPVKTKNSRVWVIPAGELSGVSSFSPDVLFSIFLPALLNGLREMFDVILIKTAPVLCGSHTRIIEKYCDGILFVMASGKSDKKTTQNMIDQLVSTPIEIKKRRFLNGEEDKIPELPGETNSNLKKLRIILTKVKDNKEEIYGYKQ